MVLVRALAHAHQTTELFLSVQKVQFSMNSRSIFHLTQDKHMKSLMVMRLTHLHKF